VVKAAVLARPSQLAVLSLLGACSGMLDLPDQPRVSTEATAPLQPPPHGSREGAGFFREPRSWSGGAEASPIETLGASAADAGVDETEDGGVDVRVGAG
jgi:hypothetical protein